MEWALQNIDPLVLLQPALSISLSLGAVIWWWDRRSIRGVVLVLSAGAYFIAIGAKYAIQIPTIAAVETEFGTTSVGLGVYYGLQTVFLEVGLAYLLAVYATRSRGLKASDAVPYGLSLAFWENGVLLGLVSALNFGVLYLLLAGGGSEAATVYSQLVTSQPGLFQPTATLLPSILIATLERFSSLLAHLAWGMLCVFSAVSGKKRYLAYALPMGLLDATVPFAHLNIDLFEAGIFILSVGFIVVAWKAKSQLERGIPATSSVSKD